ncbi:hypothetical protein F5Y06DRAFT_276023 [Hypoxylon sp. FL0890]|nr:hypothetical protein F5Y06DRAFT_276023 [Hypoxylon sp. FL0890]
MLLGTRASTNHQGENGFRRRDHLIQHLKAYHRIETADEILQSKSVKPIRSEAGVTTTPTLIMAPTSAATATTLVGSEIPMPSIPFNLGAGSGNPAWGFDGTYPYLDQHTATVNPYGTQNYTPIQQNWTPENYHYQHNNGSEFML